MNYEHTDVVFVIEKSKSLKRYLSELLDAYISPAISFFSGGISEENDVFFTQSSLVQYAVVFYGSELSVLGGVSQMETQGPTTSQLSILNAIKDANYSYKNTCRQAYILEALQTATEVFKCLSGGNVLKDNTKRCLVLVTQSVPINNPWATATPENILQEMKRMGVKTSIISAHKMVELYRLFESAGGDRQSITLKNYATKPQHLVLLNGFSLQERTVSPSLISQPPTANVNAPISMGMNTASTGPSPNPTQQNRPTPSPGLLHSGSPIPHQQPNQLTRPVVMNQTPQSQPMQTQPQVTGGIMIRPGQHMPPQANVPMTARPNRWPMGNTMMVQTQQPNNQNPQMQQVPQQLQNAQMTHGGPTMQPVMGMSGGVGSQIQQPTQQQQQHQQQQHQQQQQQHQQQQQQQQQSEVPTQVQQPSQPSQMRNSLSPFSNRMSPMSTFSHSSPTQSQISMSTQFSANPMCGGMSNNAIRASYPTPTRGSSPIPPGSQSQPSNMCLPNGNQPRYMQQQMMGSVNMMRPQMMAQSGQMITRPPPPEYRQAAMMQQHQAMIGQSMPQTIPQLHQGMGQLSFQGMRPGYRPNMAGTPMNNMMGNMNQQTMPGSLPSMKGTMVQGNGMSIPVTIGGTMGQGVGPNGGMPGSQVAGGGASMGMMNARPTMMQRTRPPNVNMGIPGMGMSTQMPPSRPEWRQMMMQQNQGGIMMGPGIRHSYQQIQQPGTMMGQGNQMIPMQRSQAHMMGMMSVQQNNPNIQHGSGTPMQGGGNMAASLNNPGMQSMPMGARMQQHSMVTMGQNQVHLGMQMNQPGMQDVRSSNMPQQGHVGSPSNISQVAASNANSMGPVGTTGGHSSLNSVGSVNSGMNHISSTNMNQLSQQGVSANNPNPITQTQNTSTTSGSGNTFPRSPMGQIHPCSPAASANVQQRPLSNPSVGLSGPQNINNNANSNKGNNNNNSNNSSNSSINCSSSSQSLSGGSSPLLVCSSSPQMILTHTQGRSTLPSIRNTNPNHGTQQHSIVMTSGGSLSGQHVQSLNQSGQNMSNSQPGMMSKNISCSVGGNAIGASANTSVLGCSSVSQRPDSRGGGNGATKSTVDSNLSTHPPSNASTDFDIVFSEGEFAALLN